MLMQPNEPPLNTLLTKVSIYTLCGSGLCHGTIAGWKGARKRAILKVIYFLHLLLCSWSQN